MKKDRVLIYFKEDLICHIQEEEAAMEEVVMAAHIQVGEAEVPNHVFQIVILAVPIGMFII